MAGRFSEPVAEMRHLLVMGPALVSSSQQLSASMKVAPSRLALTRTCGARPKSRTTLRV